MTFLNESVLLSNGKLVVCNEWHAEKDSLSDKDHMFCLYPLSSECSFIEMWENICVVLCMKRLPAILKHTTISTEM